MTDNEQRLVFSRNLNHYLNSYRYTQREVADRIGVSAQTFNTWCQGIALPRMGKIQKLADFFGISKSDLIDPPSNCHASPLHPAVQRVAEIMEDLNEEGINKIVEYAEDISTNGKYKKCDSVQAEA